MFKLNGRNVEDILKDSDNIEKFADIYNTLYHSFIAIAEMKHSVETFVHFTEALALYLSINSDFVKNYSSTLKDDKELIDRFNIKKSYTTGCHAIDCDTKTVDSTALLEKYGSCMKTELEVFGMSLFFTSGSPFNKYVRCILPRTMLQSLATFNGNTPYSMSLILTLYYFCEMYSLTNILSDEQRNQLFSEENLKMTV